MDLSDIALEVTKSFGLSTPTIARRTSLHIPRKTSWGTPIPPPSSQADITSPSKENLFDNVDLGTRSPTSASDTTTSKFNTLKNIAALGLSFSTDETEIEEPVGKQRFSIDGDESHYEVDRPFNKWVKNLQRRAADRRKTVGCDATGDVLEKELFHTPSKSLSWINVRPYVLFEPLKICFSSASYTRNYPPMFYRRDILTSRF